MFILPIAEEMYDEFRQQIIMDPKLPHSPRLLFQR